MDFLVRQRTMKLDISNAYSHEATSFLHFATGDLLLNPVQNQNCPE